MPFLIEGDIFWGCWRYYAHTLPEMASTATPFGYLYSADKALPSVAPPISVPPVPPPASVCTV